MRHGSQTAGQLTSALLSSSEYASKFGLPVNNSNVVNQLYINAMGRQPSSTELASGANRLSGGSLYSLFMEIIYPGSEFRSLTNPLYIREIYFTILGRDPDGPGFSFWAGIANSAAPGLLLNGPPSARLGILGPVVNPDGSTSAGFVGSPEFTKKWW